MKVITLGDPYSINVEIIDQELEQRCRQGEWVPSAADPLLIVGSLWHWQDQRQRLGRSGAGILDNAGVRFVDVGVPDDSLPAEQLSMEQRGAVAVRALHYLRELPEARRVLTAPIDKQAARAAGFAFDGQTEFFEDLWHGQAVMILAGPRLRVGLVTNHVPLRHVSNALTTDLIVAKGDRLAAALRDHFGIHHPRVAVTGVNPHCGDGGMFGDEDSTIVAPAVTRLNEMTQERAVFAGPLPADTAFYQAATGQFDAVLAMYHDQGLGPLKTLHFDDAVNLSGGLPHLRVSPDHGPARDHFLRGTASGRSFAACLDLVLGPASHPDVRGEDI